MRKKKKYFKIIKKNKFDLSKAKYVLIRQNPPFNMDYVTSTLLLDTIKHKTTIIMIAQSNQSTAYNY